jgi:tRNA-specific adenosine deaminase 2
MEVPRVVFGCFNDKFGGAGSILSLHEGVFEIESGVLEAEAIAVLKEFYELGNPNAPDSKRQRPLVE